MREKLCNPFDGGVRVPKRAENIINHKISLFYIEVIPNFVFQLQEKIVLGGSRKKSIFEKSRKNHEFCDLNQKNRFRRNQCHFTRLCQILDLSYHPYNWREKRTKKKIGFFGHGF